MALRPIPNERKSVIFEVVLQFRERPVSALVDGFFCPCKVEGLDTSRSELKERISESDVAIFEWGMLPWVLLGWMQRQRVRGWSMILCWLYGEQRQRGLLSSRTFGYGRPFFG